MFLYYPKNFFHNNKMRTTIGKNEFFFSLIFNGINTCFWTYYIYYSIKIPQVFIYLTYITYHLNSLYLFFSLLCDISLFFFNSTKLEYLNDFLRNKYGIVVRTMSIFVFFLYWTLKIVGGMPKLEGIINIIKSIYLHLFITIFVLIDLLSSNHSRHRFSFAYLGFCTLYFIFYIAICGVAIFIFNTPPYPFLENIQIKSLVIYGLVFFVVLIFCYYFQILLFEIKIKYILKTRLDYNNKKLLPKENKRRIENKEDDISLNDKRNREPKEKE